MPRFQGDNLRRNLALVEELKAHAAAENCIPAQLALAWVLSRAPYIVPIPGTSHRHRLEENAATVSLKISADTEDALLQVFVPCAASGLRYPENHLCVWGSDQSRVPWGWQTTQSTLTEITATKILNRDRIQREYSGFTGLFS
jgi:Aldo/keto reductase family